jgi:maltooligosyltrehalose trehalohydrolase
MDPGDKGYFTTVVREITSGTRYFYRLSEAQLRPDPASRFQPEGVHGPSEVVDPNEFKWEDQTWKGIPLEEMILYEIHTGTFTQEGTFEGILPHLDYLKNDLGVTAIELMPFAQFPGERNWGYDGACLYAPQNSYGGPTGLKSLVNACHKKGLAVLLDVVYNHLGPEGNYLGDFGPYFTDRYRTPWGPAVNFDGPESDKVRHYIIDNALYWVTEYHVDGLRIDAVHGIFDFSARHILYEMSEAVHGQAKKLGRPLVVFAESDLNDVRVIQPPRRGGYGLDAQWNDDFHHSLHTLLTGEGGGYYQDFGDIRQLVKALREGFVFDGRYSSFRRRRHGSSSKRLPPHQFIVFSQNHDQVGNRARGDRLTSVVSFEALKLAAAVVLLSPNIPLLFMGEEYGEEASFQYFISHSDQKLIEAVRKGRKEEFAGFKWEDEIPDPQDAMTFFNSKIDLDLRRSGKHRTLLEFYKRLIKMRKETPSLTHLTKKGMKTITFRGKKALLVKRQYERDQTFAIFNFEKGPVEMKPFVEKRHWVKLLDSASEEWGGMGSSVPDEIESDGSEVSLKFQSHHFVLYRQLN